jgi:hypothetical protein
VGLGHRVNLDRRAVASPDRGTEAETTEDQMAMVEPMEMESTKAEQKTSSAEQKTPRDQEAMTEQKSTKDQEELWRMPPPREN